MEGKIIVENGRQYRIIPGKPYYHASKKLDVWINGLKEDRVVGEKAIEYWINIRINHFSFLCISPKWIIKVILLVKIRGI